MNTPKKIALSSFAVMLTCLGSLSAWAIDGTVLIDQNKALAGNVTPGDASGFPVTISVPGSYKLAGNLTVATVNDTAVEITANDVTLDLNGFTIQGPVKCADSGSGSIACSPAAGLGYGVISGADQRGTVVQNGHVQGMGNRGINSIRGVVRSVTSRSNGNDGIAGVFVQDSYAEFNGRYGVAGTTIENSFATNNGVAGFAMFGSLRHSTSESNFGVGLICSGAGSYLGNTFSSNLNGQLSSCANKNAGGNFCNGLACPP